MKKKTRNIKTGLFITAPMGSILIWSVLLGFLLTSVFFFFSVRQRAAITTQRDTAEIMNARTYLESYADYAEKLDADALNGLKASGIDFDGVHGTVTNESDDITGIADAGATIEYKFSGEIFIEWNKCSDNFKGSLILNNILYEHDGSAECATNNSGYDDIIGPIPVADPFEIKTLNAPFHYRITARDSLTKLIDNKWRLNIKMDLSYDKKAEIERVF